jgi:hypothetical protein
MRCTMCACIIVNFSNNNSTKCFIVLVWRTFLIFISRVLVGIQGLVSMKFSVSFCDDIKQEKFRNGRFNKVWELSLNVLYVSLNWKSMN